MAISVLDDFSQSIMINNNDSLEKYRIKIKITIELW